VTSNGVKREALYKARRESTVRHILCPRAGVRTQRCSSKMSGMEKTDQRLEGGNDVGRAARNHQKLRRLVITLSEVRRYPAIEAIWTTKSRAQEACSRAESLRGSSTQPDGGADEEPTQRYRQRACYRDEVSVKACQGVFCFNCYLGPKARHDIQFCLNMSQACQDAAGGVSTHQQRNEDMEEGKGDVDSRTLPEALSTPRTGAGHGPYGSPMSAWERRREEGAMST